MRSSRFPVSHSVCALLTLVGIACATPTSDPLAGNGPKIRIGDVTDSARATREVDTEVLLRRAIERSLSKYALLASADATGDIELNIEVDRYEPGNAFKRWLLPGYGATVLRVRGELVDPRTGAVVSRIDHQRRVDVGGGFTVGAWSWIFDSVAADLAKELASERTAEGFAARVGSLQSSGEDSLIVTPRSQAGRGEKNPPAEAARVFSIEPFVDQRAERSRIGERHAALGVSMGDLRSSRDVAAFLQSVVADALRDFGYSVEDSAGTAIGGAVAMFWVRTDTTPLYWDVVGEIELRISLRNSPESIPYSSTTIGCEHTERTWLWPTRSLVEEVIDACVEKLVQSMKSDPIWRESPFVGPHTSDGTS